MAGDTGNPQCQPTDLSMKSRRDIQQTGDKIDTYDYETTNSQREYEITNSQREAISWSKLNELNTFYAPRENSRNKDCEFVHKKRKARTPGPEPSKNAIQAAINAITKSLTPTSSCIRSIQGGHIIPTPVSDDDAPFILKVNGRPSLLTPTTPVIVRSINSPCRSSPEMEVVKEERQMAHHNTPDLYSGTPTALEDTRNWKCPAPNRPTYLDLGQVSNLHTPTSNFLNSPRTMFGAVSQQSLAEVMASPPETPGVQGRPQKRRKRKLGPGRGWKFHDLSNDGGVNKKRTYAHNKLENEILQRFQDKVCVKTLPTPDGTKDKLIVVEPSDIVDVDLVRCGTALRMLFDKEAGTYKLQLLPHTIEEGPLSDQEKVIQAVSKMLGENNQVLCPCAFGSLLRTGSSVIIGEDCLEGCEIVPSSSVDQHLKTPVITRTIDTESVVSSKEPLEKQRNRLLWSLNNDLTRNNNALVGATAAGRKVCLMWHTPQMVHLPGKPGKKSTPLSKWCVNCQTTRFKKS